MILKGTIITPTGNDLGKKLETIEAGREVTPEQLKLIQFAALFNIVGFNSRQIEPKNRNKLRAELERLEKDFNIEYILRSNEPTETDGMPIQPEQRFKERDSFIERVLAQAKETRLPQSLPPDQLFLEYCKIHAKLPDDSFMQSNTTGISVKPQDFIQINYEDYKGDVKKIDLYDRTEDSLNSFFLAQIMGNSLGQFASEGNFSPERFYLAARRGLRAIEKRTKTSPPVPQTQKDAFRIIASRNRMQSVQNVLEHLREFFTQPRKSKGRDGK